MRARSPSVILLAALTLACSAPPHKEMDQAQGALDAARAAGAETFANAEFREAQRALEQSEQAVTQRDYRLALNYALDARERAQDAARAGADRKAEARGRAERALGSAENAIRDAEARLEAARAAKLRPRDVAPARKALDATRDALQKARAAMGREAYLEIPRILEPPQAHLSGAMKELGARAAARPVRRRR